MSLWLLFLFKLVCMGYLLCSLHPPLPHVWLNILIARSESSDPTPKKIGFMRLAHVFEHMILLELVFLFLKGTLCFSRRTRITCCISLCFWFYREAGLTLSLAELECKRIFCCICELLTIIALNTYIFL